MTAPDPLKCMAVRAAHDESLCNEPESAHCRRCELCPDACICPRELTPGKYRMTVEIEVDEHNLIYPHDTGEMHLAEWWQQRNATFTETSAYAAILAGRRNRAAETERLRGQVQAQQAEINRLRHGADETRPEPCTEQTPAQLWHWLLEAPIHARLGFVTKLLAARAAERTCIARRCITKENDRG